MPEGPGALKKRQNASVWLGERRMMNGAPKENGGACFSIARLFHPNILCAERSENELSEYGSKKAASLMGRRLC